MLSALSATSATSLHTIPSNSCESSPSTPSTMTSASTFSNASSHLDGHAQAPKINGAASSSPAPAGFHDPDGAQKPSKNVWAQRNASPGSFPALPSPRLASPSGTEPVHGGPRGVNGQGSAKRFESTPNDFPALAEARSPAAGSPPTRTKSNNPSGGNTRASSINGRDEKGDEPATGSSGAGKKNKWVAIPPAEMQAALDQARPQRSHSHSRTSSRRNSPGELRRGRRLPEDGTAVPPAARRKQGGLATPTYGAGLGGGAGSGSVLKPATANPSPGPTSTLPASSPLPPLTRREAPRLSAPVTSLRPIPPLPAEGSREQFGSFDSIGQDPEPSGPDESTLERRPKQCGRFGIAVGVPHAERNQRRTAARRPLSIANDVEENWTGDGRWDFGVLGTFDRRVGLQRGGGASGSGPGHASPSPLQYGGPVHSPRPRGARGRGMGGMRGFRGGYRGGAGPGFRSSPADPEYAMLPPMPPIDHYGAPYGFNPYAYGGYAPPPPPMWNPYAPYGGMPPMPPPPPPSILGGTAPPPVPVTNVGYMLDQMRYYVLGQVEYYFSVQNMCQDLYLRQQMDSQGWIPVSTVASFNRLRRLTSDAQLIREMMHMSSLVELSQDGDKARMALGAWAPFVLPDAQDASSAASEPMGGTSPATSVDVDGEGVGKGALGLVGVGGGGVGAGVNGGMGV